MKLCAIQFLCVHTADQADSAVDFLVAELERCDASCDLILTPEYSNAPATFPSDGVIPYVRTSTERLINAAKATVQRCQAIVAFSCLCEVSPGVYRNATRFF